MLNRNTDARIQKMFVGDCISALAAVIGLWVLYLFVLYEAMPSITSDNILIALLVSGGLVLLFNTASIIAMIRHYANDKEHIYGLDLRYLDAMKQDNNS